MDGNGRWAQNQGLARVKGHEKGVQTVREITIYCAKHPSILFLTLYAFSTENWKRPKHEINFLMNLLEHHLKTELEFYQRHNVRFETIGDISCFSPKLQERIQKTKDKTKANDGLTQVLALNYGSRDEIARAAKRAAQLKEEITPESIASHLDTHGIPDVDILVRTGGEMRLSNFLLWQSAYAELFFTPTMWPDFTSRELEQILADFTKRERRFGGLA